jgi:siderophore synthetase component
MVWRDPPRLAAGQIALPLSVLSAPSPASGRPILTEAVTAGGGDPGEFAAALAGLLVPPLLRLLRRGAALEAHGQNTLVVLAGGRPVRICYRDLGGLRLSPKRLAADGVEVPPLAGDLPCDDPEELRTKLLAALGTALGELAATLDREYGAAGALWRAVAEAARHAGDRGALGGADWPVKATTAMRLAADPLADLWTTLPNPLGDHA